MACDTCGHTMQSAAPSIWWCPRCGSLKTGAPFAFERPKLVDRCREFEKLIGPIAMNVGWVRLGIAESIREPNR